jgi:hypothetical protein
MNTLILVLVLAFGLFMAFAPVYAGKHPGQIDRWIRKLDGFSAKHKAKARELRKGGDE